MNAAASGHVKRLICRKAKEISESLELRCRVDQVDMAEHECTAAIALDTKVIKDLFRILALVRALSVVLPQVRYWLAAGKAADWDDHGFSPR
jgi:hypothetical protein